MLRIKTIGLHRVHVNWLAAFQYAFILCVILNFRSIWLHTDSLANIGRIIKLLMGLSVVGGVIARKKVYSRSLLKCLVAILCVVLYGAVWFLADPIKSTSIITVLIQLLAIVVYCALVEISVDDTLHKFTSIVLIISVRLRNGYSIV